MLGNFWFIPKILFLLKIATHLHKNFHIRTRYLLPAVCFIYISKNLIQFQPWHDFNLVFNFAISKVGCSATRTIGSTIPLTFPEQCQIFRGDTIEYF